jgi:cell division protein FtsB
MFSFFIGKPKFDSVLYNIELKIDAQQKQIDELRGLVLQLAKQINTLEIEVNYLSNQKYGKGI